MSSRFVDFNGYTVDVLDFLIIGYCLASDCQVIGVTFPLDDVDSTVCTCYFYFDLELEKFYFAVCDGCEDTEETRKNAVFKYCESLTKLYHDIPMFYREIMNGEDHCASIRSIKEFNINIDSL